MSKELDAYLAAEKAARTASDALLASYDQRLAALEAAGEQPPTEPPVTPPTTGTVVPAGTGLIAAINKAPAGSTLILRGGDHVMGSWGSGTTPGVTIGKKLSLWAYEGEAPRIHAGTSRPNLIYAVGAAADVDMHGIQLATVDRAWYDDSMGSALVEARGGGKLTLRDHCILRFAPNSVSERQHQFYVADSPGLAAVYGCEFDGGKNKGTGFHCYHSPGGKAFVHDSEFYDYGFDTTNGIAVIIDQPGCDIEVLRNKFANCRYAAIQHRASARAVVRDNRGTNCARGLQKSSVTNLSESGNVWT